MELKLPWLHDNQRTFLERGYLKQGVTPEERYSLIATTIKKYALKMAKTQSAVNYLQAIDERFLNYISKGWISFATPVLSNFGEPDNLPISCNHGQIQDSLDSIFQELHQTAMLAKYGAGTAKNFSKIRSIGEEISTGGTSESVINWIAMYDNAMNKVAQNKNRRGFFTAYLSVTHKEILDFLKIGGKESNIQGITTAVTIHKGWMQDLKDGVGNNRQIWGEILKSRAEKGFPYVLWEDNCNINSPQIYIDKGEWLDNANICAEAIEYCSETKEFACCLSSVVASKWNEWNTHPNFIFDVNIMLDCVIEEYIEKGQGIKGLGKAIKFAKEHRAIGVGVLGFHTYLQENNIVWGSLECYRFNNELFKFLRQEGDRASKWMAVNFGEPEYLKGYGYRNTSRMAQAPTKSTSFIMGELSQGVEPIKSNYHQKDLAKIQIDFKNPALEKVLDKYFENTDDNWKSILQHNGSVQHLGFLSQHEKDVFKTFAEISQIDIIKLAGQRQKYIDMGQSINLMIHPKTPPKEVNKLMMTAYEEGLKTLYYQYSINAAQEYNQSLMECSSCEA